MRTVRTGESVPNAVRVPATDRDYSFIVTEYVGNEQEVLRLRNASRDNPKTREYVDWRYQAPPGTPGPKVFWLVSASGERVGMASLIFRPYWCNGSPVHVAVLGDISLAQRLRGRGLGQQLLRFATEYLSEHYSGCYGFVMPTEAARRSLAAVGWSTAGELIPHVLAIDPAPQLRALLRSVWLTQRICQIYRSLARMLLRRHLMKDGALQFVSEPDEALGELWRSSPKDGRVMRDLGVQSLTWRYVSHPRTKFTFVKLMRGDELLAFMVLTLDAQSRTCSIYDVLAKSAADLSCILAQYAIGAMERRDVSTLRISVDDKHPYRRSIRMLGFMPRLPGAPFQRHRRSATGDRTPWSITSGDKDV
jgi:GNAT superfamily N-acetyltransferase